jgi:hypothetical protein
MLGYKPFFKEYTTDWEYATKKMETSFFTKPLLAKSPFYAMSWDQLSERARAWANGGGTYHFIAEGTQETPKSNGINGTTGH